MPLKPFDCEIIKPKFTKFSTTLILPIKISKLLLSFLFPNLYFKLMNFNQENFFILISILFIVMDDYLIILYFS